MNLKRLDLRAGYTSNSLYNLEKPLKLSKPQFPIYLIMFKDLTQVPSSPGYALIHQTEIEILLLPLLTNVVNN